MNIFDISGLSGFCLYVAIYGGLQLGKIDGNSMRYTLLNAAAASLVLIGLWQNFNLASALIQIMWISISVVGIYRMLYRRKKTRISGVRGVRDCSLLLQSKNRRIGKKQRTHKLHQSSATEFGQA